MIIHVSNLCNFRFIPINITTADVRHFQFIHIIHYRMIFIQYEVLVILHFGRDFHC